LTHSVPPSSADPGDILAWAGFLFFPRAVSSLRLSCNACEG